MANVRDSIDHVAYVRFGEIRLKAKKNDMGAWLACYMPFTIRERTNISITVLMIIISSVILVIFVFVVALRIVVAVGIVRSVPLIICRLVIRVVILEIEH